MGKTKGSKRALSIFQGVRADWTINTYVGKKIIWSIWNFEPLIFISSTKREHRYAPATYRHSETFFILSSYETYVKVIIHHENKSFITITYLKSQSELKLNIEFYDVQEQLTNLHTANLMSPSSDSIRIKLRRYWKLWRSLPLSNAPATPE